LDIGKFDKTTVVWTVHKCYPKLELTCRGNYLWLFRARQIRKPDVQDKWLFRSDKWPM